MTIQKTQHLKIFGQSDDNIFVVDASTGETVATDSYFAEVGTVQIRNQSGYHIASFKAAFGSGGDWVIEPHRDVPESVLADLSYVYKTKKVGDYSPVIEIKIPLGYTVEVLFIDYDDYFHNQADINQTDNTAELQKYVIYGDDEEACACPVGKLHSHRMSPEYGQRVNYDLYVGYRHVCTFIVSQDDNKQWFVSVKPRTLSEDDKKTFNIRYVEVDDSLPVRFYSEPSTQAICFEVPPNSNVYGHTHRKGCNFDNMLKMCNGKVITTNASNA